MGITGPILLAISHDQVNRCVKLLAEDLMNEDNTIECLQGYV